MRCCVFPSFLFKDAFSVFTNHPCNPALSYLKILIMSITILSQGAHIHRCQSLGHRCGPLWGSQFHLSHKGSLKYNTWKYIILRVCILGELFRYVCCAANLNFKFYSHFEIRNMLFSFSMLEVIFMFLVSWAVCFPVIWNNLAYD